MKTGIAQVCVRERFLLGEGPCWNQSTGEWSWVDIKTGTLHLMDTHGQRKSVQCGQYLGAAIPTEKGYFVAAMTTGLYLMDRNEVLRRLDVPEGLAVYQRFNDAKCDPVGRLLAGTMPLFMNHMREGGKLYRFEGGKAIAYDLNVTVPNGMAWSADGSTLYLVDTGASTVDRLKYDLQSGSIQGRETVIHVQNGLPDGMTIDAEGMLWVAIWGAGEVRRYDPASACVLETVRVNAKQVSSCCFGGEDLKTLLITTSAEGDEASEAGCIFSYRSEIHGLPAVLYRD